MPKVVITNKKGLVQEAGSGFESQVFSKSVLNLTPSVLKIVPAAANATDVDYTGGKFFVVHGHKKSYQLYFSSVESAAQPVPSKVDGNHELVSIGNIAAAANAATVATAIETAIGAGSGSGIAELTVSRSSANLVVASVNCQKARFEGAGNLGNIDSTHLTTFTQIERGSGDTTPGVALRKGCVNVLGSADVGASFVAINFDGTGAPDNAKYTLADGDYIGQQCIIVRKVGASTSSQTPAVIVTINKLRDFDGGAIKSTDDVTFENSENTDGSTLMHLMWDGVSWIYQGPPVAEMGFSI